jgi:uncharacterized protein (DUF2062 family)
MSRKHIQRHLPDPERILQLRALGPLRHRLATPGLWQLNRRSASGAVLVGLYCAFMPVPLQMLLAAAIALTMEINLPLCLAVVWVSNPLTVVPMFYIAYVLGCLLLGQPLPDHAAVQQLLVYSREHITGWFHHVDYTQAELPLKLAPLLLGTQVAGLLAGMTGYVGMRLYWRWHVVRAWQVRRAARLRQD